MIVSDHPGTDSQHPNLDENYEVACHTVSVRRERLRCTSVNDALLAHQVGVKPSATHDRKFINPRWKKRSCQIRHDADSTLSNVDVMPFIMLDDGRLPDVDHSQQGDP